MRKHQGMAALLGTLALLVLLNMTAAASPAAPGVVGDWNGSISTGSASLRVVIHVSQDKDGNLTAMMDSPDQGASGIAITSITFKEPALHFEIQRFGAAYDGTLNEGGSEIAGNWKQGSASLPLTFKRTGK